ncbi:MAG: flagellar basal body rod protein FlgB [Gammaproteobacteria bacterium]|nr:flagellar basal body rod protein FlgB [Gammaproteobacteria bacterium]
MPSLDNLLAAHATSIAVRSQRAEMIAGNLANADTPGYRAKDIDFAAVLSNTKASNFSGMAVTHRAHLTGKTDPLDHHMYFRDAPEATLDENSVDTEYERAQFTDNAVRYQASVQFLNSRLSGLMRAIRGE